MPPSYSEFEETYLDPFLGLYHIYDEELGFIVWRNGTGGNVELLHIRTFSKRRGFGRRLFYGMLKQLEDDSSQTPYHSVYGFTRVSNSEARAFYGELGFCLVWTYGVYASQDAILFEQSFDKLLEERKRFYVEA